VKLITENDVKFLYATLEIEPIECIFIDFVAGLFDYFSIQSTLAV
jgi:hypothetical protein